MSGLGITPGPWRFDHFLGLVVGPRGEPICGQVNGELAAEAGTVANECGLTPRQLLEQRDALLVALKETRRWAASRCPCREETPDPCTLCGATVAAGTCKAVESIFPADLLHKLDAVIKACESTP